MVLRTLIAAGLLAFSSPIYAADLPPDLASVVASAEARGLPTAPLEAKASEGLAKGVPTTRIASVLNTLLVDLDRASGLLEQANPDILFAGARALRAGASDKAVRTLADGPVGDRALHSLADLLALGVSEVDAVRVVRVASGTPTPRRDVAGLATSTAALMARGSLPDDAAVASLSGLAGQNNGVGSLPDGAPGKKDNPGNAFGHDKTGKGGKAGVPGGPGNSNPGQRRSGT